MCFAAGLLYLEIVNLVCSRLKTNISSTSDSIQYLFAMCCNMARIHSSNTVFVFVYSLDKTHVIGNVRDFAQRDLWTSSGSLFSPVSSLEALSRILVLSLRMI